MPLVCNDNSFGANVQEALGLGGHDIQRIIIDIEADEVVKVYVKKLFCKKEVPAFIGAIKMQACAHLDVNEADCSVEFTPAAKG